MAGGEVKDAVRSAAETVSRYVKDVATLTVETRTTEAGLGSDAALAARTVIKIDGDNSSVVPGHRNEEGSFEGNSTLYELHMQNVSAAIDYRARMLDAMLTLLRSRLPG